jgi:hypothetical protein
MLDNLSAPDPSADFDERVWQRIRMRPALIIRWAYGISLAAAVWIIGIISISIYYTPMSKNTEKNDIISTYLAQSVPVNSLQAVYYNRSDYNIQNKGGAL